MSNSEGVVFADDIARAMMAARRQVTVGEVGAKLWWPATPARSKIERGRRGSRPTWTSLGAKPVAALTELLYENSTICQHLDHRVVYTFPPTVAVRGVGAGGSFADPEKLIYVVRKLGAELDAVVREDVLRGHPQRGIHRLMRMLAVPSAVNSAAVTAFMSARRLKRSVKSKI